MASADREKGFDPYYKWLGIPAVEQPCSHYRLLGLIPFESDQDVISSAADRQMAHVRKFQAGRHASESKQLLNKVSIARLCLMNPTRKEEYDRSLRQQAAADDAKPQSDASRGPSPEPARNADSPAPSSDDAPAIHINLKSKNKRRRRQHRLQRLTGLALVLFLLFGVCGIGYTLALNQDMLAVLLRGQSNSNNDASAEPRIPKDETSGRDGNSGTAEAPAIRPGFDNSARQKDAPAIAEEERDLPNNRRPWRSPVLPMVPEEEEPAEEAKEVVRSVEVVESEAKPEPKPEPEPQRVARVTHCLLPPSDDADSGPVELITLPADIGKLAISVYSCFDQRTGPKLTIAAEPKPNRWRLVLTDERTTTVALLGLVENKLQFVWAPDVSQAAEELLRWSFVEIDTGGKPYLLRFAAPQSLPQMTVNLERSETTLTLKLPVLYPEDDLRLEIESVDGISLSDETEFLQRGMKNGKTLTARLANNSHVMMDCRFNVIGKRLQAKVAFRYETPNGRDFGLTSRHVQLRIGHADQRLAQAVSAKSQLPGLQSKASRLRSLIISETDVNSAHIRPQLAKTEDQILTANKLIAAAPTLREELRFMNQLIPVGERLHDRAQVSCRFYVQHRDHRFPLSAVED